MMISTKGRYALRVIIDLAENQGEGYVPMKQVAERQNISLKYIEKILPSLTRSKVIKGVQGKGGGYRLSGEPEDYTVYDILSITEGEILAVACMSCGRAAECRNRESCRTKPMWENLQSLITSYLKSVTVGDLMKNKENELLS